MSKKHPKSAFGFIYVQQFYNFGPICFDYLLQGQCHKVLRFSREPVLSCDRRK